VYHHGAVIMRRATVAVGWRLLKRLVRHERDMIVTCAANSDGA